MRKLLALTVVLAVTAGTSAQQPPAVQAPPAKVIKSKAHRPRGHKTPPNLADLQEKSHQRHAERLKWLPRATAASFDARALGWVGPVKDQRQCGSCWDFSGTGVVEIAYNKAGVGGGASTFILSEQYTLDCGQNGGCNGDDNTTVLAWATATGLPLTSAYGPYQGGPGRCNGSPGTLYKIPDWGFADSNGGQGVTSVADIKAAIQSYGSVGCAVAADDAFESWGDDNPSFASPFTGSGSRSINHDIKLVGWQDDTSKAGGYWILENSWSEDWGVNGYMAISYGANLVGTEAVFALPPVNPNPPAPSPAPTGLTYALTGTIPSGASIDGSGNFTWPNPTAGLATITFTVSAGSSPATGTLTVQVMPAGSSSIVVNPIPVQSATAGVPFTFRLSDYVTTSPAAGHK